MTKGREALPWRAVAELKALCGQVVSGMNNVCEAVVTTITANESANLPFVLPSEAEGSAVLLIRSEGSYSSVQSTRVHPQGGDS
jgi:hypothetical protein